MTAPDLMTALDADGCSTKPVRRGTLNTTLSVMRKEGRLPRPDGTGLIVPIPAD